MGMVATVLSNVLNSCGHNDIYSTVSLIDLKVGDYYSNGRSQGNPLEIHNISTLTLHNFDFKTALHLRAQIS